MAQVRTKLPAWFKVRYVNNQHSEKVAGLMEKYNLHSVCQSAHCPNCAECWGQGTASFMILGEYCTRGCRFCAVKKMARPLAPDSHEPEHLAEAVKLLNLRYVVITSVTRDDLPDGGASHFASCVHAIKEKSPETIIETLIPDFKADEDAIQAVVDAAPHVISHNIETVERLTPKVRDPRAGYRQSLKTLGLLKPLSGKKIIAKSGMMVGLGETDGEVEQTMKDLRKAGVEILTIGQYLSPSPNHLPVQDFKTPETFKTYEKMGYGLGFKYMACGPLVRSSYKAGEPFIKGILKASSAH